MGRFDLAVIGGGWAGYTAAARARGHGLSVALVERDRLGGTCLHRGCIPTKALLQSAEHLQLARRLGEFGVRTTEPSLDFDVVRARKDQIVARLYRGLQQLVAASGVQLYQANATIAGPGIIHLDPGGLGTHQAIQAQTVLVATGSRPKQLPGLSTDGCRILDSDQALQLDHLPRSVIVLGGGAVGVEFASFYRDSGANVTIVELLPRLLPLEDKEVSTLLARLFAQRGITVLTDTTAVLDSLRTSEDAGVGLDVRRGETLTHLQADCLLVAVGREPLTADLGLEAAGVELRQGFVVVDEDLRSTVPWLLAAGDVTGELLLAHVAAAQGARAADIVAGKPSVPVNASRLPRATYCRPQVAGVGLSEEEALALGHSVVTGRAQLRANGKALILGEPDGFVKVVADAQTDDLLGLHLIGAGVTELAAEGALVRLLDSSLWELAQNVHPHPTLAEAIGEAAQAARRQRPAQRRGIAIGAE